MSSPYHNARLSRVAQQEVTAVLAALPRDRRAKLSITFEPKPSAALVAGGIDADRTLGLFTGVSSARIQGLSAYRHRSLRR